MDLNIIVTEGYTDCALVEAIIENCLGFEKCENTKQLPDGFKGLVGIYPQPNGDMKRGDTPHFFRTDQKLVMVKSAGGQTNITKAIFNCVDTANLSGIVQLPEYIIFTDADKKHKDEINREFARKFKEIDIIYESPYDSFICEQNKYQCDLYILPQKGQGAVEKVLLQIADKIYPEVTEKAAVYRNAIMEDDFQELRKKKWAKDTEIQEFYADKAQLGAITSVLKPDRPVGYAVKDELILKRKIDELKTIEEFNVLVKYLEEKLICV